MTQIPGPYARIPFTSPDQTVPKVGYREAVILAFKNYANFEGVSRRGEYWWFMLFVVTVSLALRGIGFGLAVLALDGHGVAFGVVAVGVVAWLWALATLLPQLAVAVRRLRDAGHHWATLFLALIPIVGSIILIVFLASPSKLRAR